MDDKSEVKTSKCLEIRNDKKLYQTKYTCKIHLVPKINIITSQNMNQINLNVHKYSKLIFPVPVHLYSHAYFTKPV